VSEIRFTDKSDPHYSHALQLHQAKLSFPSVHPIVDVYPDELCAQDKSRTVMTHAERCESVRHCRRIYEIVL
jgi:choline-phosphate cytidylyltransferase